VIGLIWLRLSRTANLLTNKATASSREELCSVKSVIVLMRTQTPYDYGIRHTHCPTYVFVRTLFKVLFSLHSEGLRAWTAGVGLSACNRKVLGSNLAQDIGYCDRY
jgi:hypothetical protein